jgi:LemA protein
MNATRLTLWIAAAVLLFWTVGAYNRLVRHRNAILRAYADLDTQIQLRNEVLQRLAAALQPMFASAPEPIDALLAAHGQCRTASAHARQRPYMARALASLALAEQVLADTRSRVDATVQADAEALAASGGADIVQELAAVDHTLGFARQRFNTAVERHNEAVQQFPTQLLAAVFGFRPAGRL